MLKISQKDKITILGDGGWGTTLSILLCKKGFKVTLWGAFEDNILAIEKSRVNNKFLPHISIPKSLKLTSSLDEAVTNSALIVVAIPSQFIRQTLRRLARKYISNAAFLNVSKGIEIKTGKTISSVISEELGSNKQIAVLSGPTIAIEVAKGIPTAAVISSKNKMFARLLQDIFMTDRFRIYINPDVLGVELGGALKNIIAIGCGISDGLGFGTNTKSALLARGLAEMSRLGAAMGAKRETFSGISGLGDLVTTCISPYSRNRFVGEEIGKGKKLKEILSSMNMVAEGVTTVKAGYFLSKKYNVSMPITEQVYKVLYKNKDPRIAVDDLMTREKKEE